MVVEKEEEGRKERGGKKRRKKRRRRNKYSVWSLKPKIFSIWLFIENIQQPQFYIVGAG